MNGCSVTLSKIILETNDCKHDFIHMVSYGENWYLRLAACFKVMSEMDKFQNGFSDILSIWRSKRLQLITWLEITFVMDISKQYSVQIFFSCQGKCPQLITGSKLALKNESFQLRNCATVCLSYKKTFEVSPTIEDRIKKWIISTRTLCNCLSLAQENIWS